MLMFVLAFLSGVAGAAVASAPPAISQLPNGDIVFRDYPERARTAGEHGVIEFRVRADSTGVPITCEVTLSSGFDTLDQETCHLLRHHAYFQPVGKSPLKVLHRGRVRWRLPVTPPQVATQAVARTAPAVAKQPASPKPPALSEAAPPSPAPAKVASVKNGKMICKRVPRTDTIVGTERVCRRVEAGQK